MALRLSVVVVWRTAGGSGLALALAGCVAVVEPALGTTPTPTLAAASVAEPAPRALIPAPAVDAPGPAPPALYVRCTDARDCPQAVGVWVRPAEPAPERCTASLVAPNRVLTAAHCLAPGARHAGASCRGAWVAFPDSTGGASEWLACDHVVSATATDDSHALRPEHAVLQLAGASQRTPLQIDPRPVEPGSIVTVPSVTPHPLHRSSHRLATRLCRVEAPEAAVEALGPDARRVGWLSHCPIEPGNSGSPVLDYAGHIRALVHGGTDGVFAFGVTSTLRKTE